MSRSTTIALAAIGLLIAGLAAGQARVDKLDHPVTESGPELFEQGKVLEARGQGPEAVKLYTRAARNGHAKAAYRLGEIYDKGISGVARDASESKKWFNAARVLGEPPQRM